MINTNEPVSTTVYLTCYKWLAKFRRPLNKNTLVEGPTLARPKLEFPVNCIEIKKTVGLKDWGSQENYFHKISAVQPKMWMNWNIYVVLKIITTSESRGVLLCRGIWENCKLQKFQTVNYKWNCKKKSNLTILDAAL